MYAKEELAVRLDFEDKGAGKLTKNQTKIKNAGEGFTLFLLKVSCKPGVSSG